MEYSPSQRISGNVTAEQGSTASANAQPDNAEADNAVAASSDARRGSGVLDASNMSDPGTHRAGGS